MACGDREDAGPDKVGKGGFSIAKYIAKLFSFFESQKVSHNKRPGRVFLHATICFMTPMLLPSVLQGGQGRDRIDQQQMQMAISTERIWLIR